MTSPYYEDDFVTLYHGDCREVTAWLDADVLVTDPPYGMAHRSGMGGAFDDCRIEGDDNVAARDAVVAAWGTKPALVFGRWSVPKPVGTRAVLTWDKGDHLGMGDLKLPWKPSTEEIYVLGTGFVGKRNIGSVIRVQGIGPYQQARGERLHPTQKPVDLLFHLLDRCPPGVVADPFAGSGTTLRAAKDMGRGAVGVEVREDYCEVIAKRLSQEVFDFGGVA